MSKEKNIKVVIYRPLSEATKCTLVVETITNSLESMQEIVGGYIEIPFISEKLAEQNINVIINEEGKLINLEPSVIVLGRNDEMLDILMGNVIFSSYDNDGNQQSLNDSQIKYLQRNVFGKMFMVGNNVTNYLCPSIEV